jgi:hypothetical protein
MLGTLDCTYFFLKIMFQKFLIAIWFCLPFMVLNMHLERMTISQVEYLRQNLANALLSDSGDQYCLVLHAWIQFKLGSLLSYSQ